MKKLFFSTLACVAFAGSAFASNEVVVNDHLKDAQKNDKTEEFFAGCTILFKGVDKDGNTKDFSGELKTGGLGDCLIKAGQLIKDAEALGFTVSPDDVYITLN